MAGHRRPRGLRRGGEIDLSEALDALATRADRPVHLPVELRPRIGDSALVVMDSRAAGCSNPDGRSMLDAEEMSWLDGILRGGVRHVFVGTSLPFLIRRACTTSRR